MGGGEEKNSVGMAPASAGAFYFYPSGQFNGIISVKFTRYRVQTGAFKNKPNADNLATELKRKGFDTYIVQADGLYKVQVGAYSVKSNADAMTAKLKAAGYNTYITTQSGTPAGQPSAVIKVGSKVRVKQGAKSYTGGNLSSFVYNNVYDVIQINGDRVVIGKGTAVTAAVHKNDLILQ